MPEFETVVAGLPAASQPVSRGFDRQRGEASRDIRSALEGAKAILLDTSKRAAYDRWLEEME